MLTEPPQASLAELATLAESFLLDREMTFLNHGSFGACPRPVFDAYQRWQRELERQPVAFLGRRRGGLLAEARASLAGFVGAAPEELVFVPNATHGVNAVARSLPLEPGDEVLATDHEYGAVDRTWRFYCARAGARYINQPIPLPVEEATTVVEQLWAGVTPRTRVIAISHITSPTALIFPLAEICRRAREAGILTVIDGAHAPGQIDLQLDELGADFYTGNCHKWLCAPKGAAFLFARPERQPLLAPFVVGWGWESRAPGPSLFLDHYEWTGTHDPSAYLAVPDAIAFQHKHEWPRVRAACHTLAGEARARLAARFGLPPLAPDSPDWWGQMVAIPLPPGDPKALQGRLWDDFRIEVPVLEHGGRRLVRVSIQAYNRPDDVDRLIAALGELLPVAG